MILTFENVTKEYRLDERTTITPVRNVNLQIEQGELIVIVGRSGTGKTTLLNLAAGLIKPTSGRVMIDNVNLAQMSDKQISSIRGEKIGFVFQFPSLLPSLTIKENVALPAIFGNTDMKKRADLRATEYLSMLGLGSKLDVYPKQLSAGEQKRAFIARSMINEPSLVLADEPTSDLDNRTETEVMGILRDFNARGVTFLIVTHSLEIMEFATRAFEMDNGCLSKVQTSLVH